MCEKFVYTPLSITETTNHLAFAETVLHIVVFTNNITLKLLKVVKSMYMFFV